MNEDGVKVDDSDGGMREPEALDACVGVRLVLRQALKCREFLRAGEPTDVQSGKPRVSEGRGEIECVYFVVRRLVVDYEVTLLLLLRIRVGEEELVHRVAERAEGSCELRRHVESLSVGTLAVRGRSVAREVLALELRELTKSSDGPHPEEGLDGELLVVACFGVAEGHDEGRNVQDAEHGRVEDLKRDEAFDDSFDLPEGVFEALRDGPFWIQSFTRESLVSPAPSVKSKRDL